MDFWASVVILFRRWYITVPACLATLAMCAGAYYMVPQQYRSDSILVLTTPLSGGTQATNPDVPNSITNPMMNFDRSLALSASIVIQLMNSTETALSLGITPGGPTSYAVSNGSSNPELLETGPFIFVTATAPDARTAQELTEKVSAAAAAALAQRQDELSAPGSTHIHMVVVVPPTLGQPLTGSPMRAAAAAGALAGLMSLGAVFGFESLQSHRRRRRAGGQRATEHDDPDPRAAPGAAPGLGTPVNGARAGRSTIVGHHRVNGAARATSGNVLGVLENPARGDDGSESEAR